MYIVRVLNKATNKTFEKVFYDKKEKDNFVRKCRYSQNIEVISVFKYYEL